mgnify:CR=1 FL=1
MIPEQIWDSPDIPERGLFFGRPSGSGMPLVWAHSEYIKLARSIREGKVFDVPPAPAHRYLVEKKRSAFESWRFTDQIHSLGEGKNLRIELLAPAVVSWSRDNWKTEQEAKTRDTKLGVHIVDLARDELGSSRTLFFKVYWADEKQWEDKHFQLSL